MGQKEIYGQRVMGTIRSTFVIQKNKIIKEWTNVKAAGHAQEVLNFIKSV